MNPDVLKWLPLVPIVMQHPQLLQWVSANLPEAQQVIADFNALLTKHNSFIVALEGKLPEIEQLAGQLAPVIAQIQKGQ